jgi:protein phosphatase
VEVDFFEWELEPGDKLLLCSDGLWSAFPDPADLSRYLGLPVAPAVLGRQLVAEANWRDGSDDISAVIVSADRG